MRRYIINGLIIGILTLLTFSVNAQNRQVKKRRATAAAVVQLKGKITDENGGPLQNVSIISGEGSITEYTGKDGSFQFRTPQGSTILIEYPGYDDVVINLKTQPFPARLVLKKSSLLASENDLRDRLDGGKTYQRYFVGAVTPVSMDLLKKYPDLTINNGMQGQAAGLIARANGGGIGYNSADLFVRGQHTNGGNTAIVIIDGIERPLADILPDEIESIEILKDAASKILYGPAAANGVISVTTKRGEANKRIIRISAQSGALISTRAPEYLSSYDYARLYNEARRNDGLADLYLPHQLEGYKNSKGVNDLLYPDVDYYKYFTRDESLYRKAAVESFGGNDNVKYAVVVGYSGSDGLETVGKRSSLNRLSIRGNLDMKINDFITAKADVAGRMEIKDWGRRDAANIFSAIATHRPNEYPFMIDAADINLPANEDGVPYFGTSDRFSDNLYADLQYGGNTSERYASNQANLGLDFNFNKFASGLKASVYATFDNYNYLRQELVNTYPTYSVQPYLDENGDEQVRFTQMRNIALNKDQSIADNETRRTSGWRANIGYEKNSGLHDFSAFAAYRFYKYENKGTTQNVIDANYSLRLNYMFDKRYIVETDFAYMGSNKFAKGNKFFPSGAVGAAWIISNEDFMKQAGKINFLKLKADYGVLGYSGNTGYDLFKTSWHEDGTTSFNEQNNTNEYITALTRYGNPDLRWEKSKELNIGIEGLFFKNRLRGEVNYFNEKRSDIIGTNNSLYGSYIGNYAIAENMGGVKNQGFDASMNWGDKTNTDFRYNIGLNLTYSKNELLSWNENNNIEDYRKAVGQSTSAIFGLQALGLFGKDVNLAGHPVQTFGPYQNGDVAYADLNNDGVVDGRDATVIGDNFPTAAWGLNADFQYKGWGLYLLGTAETGVSKLLTNGYYWNTGLGKYSATALDRYNESENPLGSYPRLTSTGGENSFRNSSFWMESSAFFRLKNVELSYTFINRKGSGFYKKIRVYASGTNLFVLSPIKDLDPERLDAGVTNYPVYTALTGGLAVTF